MLSGLSARRSRRRWASGPSVVLHPLLDGLEVLSPAQRLALGVALGLDAGTPTERLVVSNPALALRTSTVPCDATCPASVSFTGDE